ncbi:MAG: hypothetical protein ABJF01_03660 [bacterium]
MSRTFGALCVALVCASTVAHAQPGAGAKYGARDPLECSDHSAPARGAITSAAAAKYVTCEQEHVGAPSLYLVENMKVQIGAPRPYEQRADGRHDNIDPAQPVYPIRGSYDVYACAAVYSWPKTGNSPAESNAGKNCRTHGQPHASGKCYKTTFADWQCFMSDYDAPVSGRDNVAPPR